MDFPLAGGPETMTKTASATGAWLSCPAATATRRESRRRRSEIVDRLVQANDSLRLEVQELTELLPIDGSLAAVRRTPELRSDAAPSRRSGTVRSSDPSPLDDKVCQDG